MKHDFFTAFPDDNSKGIRVKIRRKKLTQVRSRQYEYGRENRRQEAQIAIFC